MTAPQERRRRRLRWSKAALALALGLHCLGFLVLFLGDPNGLTSNDELHTPNSALVLLAGHPPTVPLVRYMPFCGGCTVGTALSIGIFAVAPPALFVWKLVPLGFGLAILYLAWRVALRAAGPSSAAIAALALALAPTHYRHFAVQGFMNHLEVMVLVMPAILVWTRLLEERRRADAFVLGLLLGGAFFFAYSSAFVPPVLLALGLVTLPPGSRARAFGWGSLGAAVGMLPWAALRAFEAATGNLTADSPLLQVYGKGPIGLLSGGAGLVERLSVMFGSAYRESIFTPSLGDSAALLSLAYSAAQAGMMGLLLAVGWAGWRGRAGQAGRDAGEATHTDLPELDLAIVLLAVAAFAAWLAVAPSMPHNWPPSPGGAPDNLHYVTMPVPLLAIAVGVGWRRAADLGLPGRIAGGLTVAAVLGVGALAFSSDLARASITTRAMHLPAAQTEVRLSPHIERADELLLAIEQRGSSDGDGPPARWEGHPHAGRFLMFELGRVFAQHVSGGLGLPEIDRVLAWAADLNEQETRSFAAGVAEGLASFSGSVEETFDFGAVLAPLAPVKGRAEPKLRVALDREALRPPLASLPDASIRRALLQGATPADQPLRAWAFGLTSARGLLAEGRSPAEVAGLVLDEARELGVAHRERVVEGLAEALGGAAGHDSEACASAREQVPPQWLEVFDEGLVRGAQWAFLWPSGVR